MKDNARRFCPNCGAEVEPYDLYCTVCGTRIPSGNTAGGNGNNYGRGAGHNNRYKTEKYAGNNRNQSTGWEKTIYDDGPVKERDFSKGACRDNSGSGGGSDTACGGCDKDR